MGIVVEFQCSQRPRAEHDWMDLTILTVDGDDTGNGVVRGIGLHNNGTIWCRRDIGLLVDLPTQPGSEG